MKKLIYILILTTQLVFSQESYTNYIQNLHDLDKTVYLEDGEYYVDGTINVNNNDFTIQGNLVNNRKVIIWTDKPIDIIQLNGRLENIAINGITFKYITDTIFKNQYTAINIGGNDKIKYGLINGNFDFDFIGNYKANVFNVDYLKAAKYSHLHFNNIKGYWEDVNIGFLLKKKDYTLFKQSTNTFKLDVNIIGANQYFYIDGLTNSEIHIMGNDKGFNKEELLYYFNGSRTTVDIFIYDVFIKDRKGLIKGYALNLNGYNSRLGYETKKQYIRAKVDGRVLVHPQAVDTYNDQNIYGNKEIKDTLTINPKGTILIEKYGTLNIGGQRIVPRPLQDKNYNTQQLIDLLKNTGIIYKN